MEKKYGTVSGYKMYPYGRAHEEGTTDGAIKGWQTRRSGGSIDTIDPKFQQMQGDITTDGGTTTSTGAKYDEWLAKQKDKPKPPAQKTDSQREDFFAKAKREREERLKGNTEKPLTPQPPEQRPSGDNYRVKAMTNKIEQSIAFMEAQKQVAIDKYGTDEVYTEQITTRINRAKHALLNIADDEKKNGLPHIPMGKNTHTKNTKGFVHGGKTTIKVDPKLSQDEETARQLDLIQSAWNNLPDDVRNDIGILNLKKSRAGNYGTIQGGRWIDRSKELIMNIHPKSDKVERNFYHEIGHNRWHRLERENPEKIQKFIEAQKEVGASPTKYAQSYLMIHQKTKDKIDRWVRIRKREGKEIGERNERVMKNNLKVTETLFHNEIHSELNAYAMGELPKSLIIANKAQMSGLLNAYKEMWDLE